MLDGQHVRRSRHGDPFARCFDVAFGRIAVERIGDLSRHGDVVRPLFEGCDDLVSAGLRLRKFGNADFIARFDPGEGTIDGSQFRIGQTDRHVQPEGEIHGYDLGFGFVVCARHGARQHARDRKCIEKMFDTHRLKNYVSE